MFMTRGFVFAVLTAVAGFGAVAGPVAADEIEDFYKGKTMKIIVGSGPGGGYDTYARLVERHLGDHIPGHPNIITQNMTGAGGVRAANYVDNVAPKDGTIIAGMQRSVALVQLMGQKGPKFKAADLNWLGSLAKEAGVCALATRTGVTSLNDTFSKKRQFTMGGTGPNSTEFWPALLRNTMAANFKLIRGYPSTPQIHLAIERGELDGVCQSWASFKVQSKEMLEKGTIKPLVQISLHPDKEMTKLGVPMLEDFLRPDNLAKGQNLDDVRLFFKLTVIPPVMGRPFAMASGVPAARVKAIRTAFVAMVKDPKFLKDAARLKRDIEFVSGEEIQKILADLSKTPASKMALLNKQFRFSGPVAKVKLPIVRDMGKVVATKRGGRKIVIEKGGKKLSASVSGSHTKVMVDGKKVKRKSVKVGMTCTFVYYGPGTRAKEVNCKQ